MRVLPQPMVDFWFDIAQKFSSVVMLREVAAAPLDLNPHRPQFGKIADRTFVITIDRCP